MNVKLAKKDIIDCIRKPDFLVYCPTNLRGNFNTGPVAKKFFSPKFHDTIATL